MGLVSAVEISGTYSKDKILIPVSTYLRTGRVVGIAILNSLVWRDKLLVNMASTAPLIYAEREKELVGSIKLVCRRP
jgi:hypothetical protein